MVTMNGADDLITFFMTVKSIITNVMMLLLYFVSGLPPIFHLMNDAVAQPWREKTTKRHTT